MKTITSIGYYIRNKSVSLGVLAASILIYSILPDGLPFVEMIYTAVSVLGVITLAPILRLLVFNEAACYAECGKLDTDLKSCDLTPALLHYWFATAICYAVPLACLATLSK